MSASSVANTAFSALQSAQAGIALTSQNVAGQAVAGYTRRKLDTGTNPVVSNSAPTLGAGVSVSGFSRDWSALLQQQRQPGGCHRLSRCGSRRLGHAGQPGREPCAGDGPNGQ